MTRRLLALFSIINLRLSGCLSIRLARCRQIKQVVSVIIIIRVRLATGRILILVRGMTLFGSEFLGLGLLQLNLQLQLLNPALNLLVTPLEILLPSILLRQKRAACVIWPVWHLNP